MSLSNCTTSVLNYFTPPTDGSRPRSHVNADENGVHKRNWTEDPRKVNIENIRGSENQYKLDDAGFQFGRGSSSHTRFQDDKEIEAEYYPDCVDLIKKITGANNVVVFDHTIRRHRPGVIDDGPNNRQPVPLVHGDHTTASSITRVHTHLPASEAPALLKRRFQIINLWRPISHVALDWPLALCDSRSVDMKNDVAASTVVFADREGDGILVKFNEAHQWKFLKGMEPDEFVVFKCFDSVQDGSVAILAPHTAFQDPDTPQGAPLRESIEIRSLVFYDY